MEKAKKAFEDAYRQDAKNTAEDGGVRYSVSESDMQEGQATADFILEVNQMIDSAKKSKRKLKIGTISENHATQINNLMQTILPEFSAEGYELWIDGTGASHIESRHGKNGTADHSMESHEAKMLIPWAAQNAEEGHFIKNGDGSIKQSSRFLNRDGTRPPEIRLQKQIDQDTVYVSECVPDSAAKRIWITSAYIKKGSNGQKLNMEGESSPQPTPEAKFDGTATKNIVADRGGEVNQKDSEYQYAVSRGDTKTAQKMVDEAAKAAGYTIKAYHGTDADTFTVFDKGKIGDASGFSILGDGFYFSDKKSVAAQYGKNVFTVYLKQDNPYSATAGDAYKLNAEKLDSDGFDSVTLPTGKGNVYMVLDPEQIKSADPITYDDEGNVIPLSERFNQKKDDIRYSVSSQEDMFPVRKDLDAVRGNIYGSDVEFPVRQDLQAEETAQDPYGDLPFDMPENLEEGQLSDAELEEDARREPITTVAERLEVKFASLRQELRTNEQNRKATADTYVQRIEELQRRYDAKPKKHTKAANAILRQIAKQEQLKQQRDAEFEKRINDIKKKIDKTRQQMQMDHTREDLLERQLRQVDEKLEADKGARNL